MSSFSTNEIIDITNLILEDKRDAFSSNQVILELNISGFSKFLTFLLNTQTPFKLSYLHANNEAIEPQNSKSEIGKMDLNHLKSFSKKNTNIDKENNIIPNVYQQYIIEGLDKYPPKLKEIAAELGVNERRLKINFEKLYGKSFYQVYIDKKMEYAANLLSLGHTASYISDRIGYSHPIKFNKMFQKHFGITPKKYQMQQRKVG